MATELHLTIRGETAAEVMLELAMLGSRAASGLGAEPPPPDAEPAAIPEKTKGNGAEAATKPRGRKAAATPELGASKVDREAVLEGLTKIYGKGDPKARAAITAFRDGHGAERLRDLKDDVIPEAAALLADLKLAESADAP